VVRPRDFGNLDDIDRQVKLYKHGLMGQQIYLWSPLEFYTAMSMHKKSGCPSCPVSGPILNCTLLLLQVWDIHAVESIAVESLLCLPLLPSPSSCLLPSNCPRAVHRCPTSIIISLSMATTLSIYVSVDLHIFEFSPLL
jgi:hypothetical protein